MQFCKVRREHTELSIFALVARKLAVLAKEDEVVRAVPLLDELEPLMDLSLGERVSDDGCTTMQHNS
jgi:hypothetical protein